MLLIPVMCSSSPVPPLLLHLLSRFLHHHILYIFFLLYTSDCQHSMCMLPLHNYDRWLLPSVQLPLFGLQKQNFQMLHCMLLILVMCNSSLVPPLLLHLLSRLPNNYILYNVHLQYTSDCQNPTYNLFLLRYYDFPPNHIYNHCI